MAFANRLELIPNWRYIAFTVRLLKGCPSSSERGSYRPGGPLRSLLVYVEADEARLEAPMIGAFFIWCALASFRCPEQWARQFLSNLTGEAASSEIRQGHDNYSTMELARQGFDRLATRVLSRLSDGGSP